MENAPRGWRGVRIEGTEPRHGPLWDEHERNYEYSDTQRERQKNERVRVGERNGKETRRRMKKGGADIGTEG